MTIRFGKFCSKCRQVMGEVLKSVQSIGREAVYGREIHNIGWGMPNAFNIEGDRAQLAQAWEN